MPRSSIQSVIAKAVFLTTMAFAPSAYAHSATNCSIDDDTETMRCFSCVKQVATGSERRYVDTCKTDYVPGRTDGKAADWRALHRE